MPRIRRALSPLWDASDTAEEDFGGDSDTEWPVDGIVGEDVDPLSEHRYELVTQVRWKDWQRRDGSDTTWMKAMSIPDLIAPWNKRMAAQRADMADESQAISLRPLSFAPLHSRNTAELAEARSEKIKRSLSGHPQDPYSCWDEEIEAQLASHPKAGEDGTRDARPKRSLRVSKTSRTSYAPSSSQNAMPPPPIPPPPRPSTSNLKPARAPSVAPSSPAYLIQNKWNRAIRESGGGAPITIVNDIDGTLPDLPDDFTYRERGYSYPDDFYRPDADVFVSCTCVGACGNAQDCDCQGPSELMENGVKVFAYTSTGLYTGRLPRGTAVVECNQYCSCNSTCPNRVVQRPRDVPIEIFKTRDRGWGARAAANIPAGKVIGCFTGELISREEAKMSKSDYAFDLDSFENHEEDYNEDTLYTVDAYHEGNWSRFVNHSCEPNIQVFPVCFDTIPENNAPYLAYTALKDIPARTELTLDYNPGATEIFARKKGKKSMKSLPEGIKECLCGAERCRGYVQFSY